MPALSLLFLSCQGAPPGQAPTTLHYRLEWKQSRALRDAATGVWQITNDLGYRVQLERGYLVMRDIELVPCDPKPPGAMSSILHGLDSLLGPAPAYAGHSGIADPSATKVAQVESLREPQPRDAGTTHPGAQTYCQAHYLIARADNAAVGLPTDIDMVDQSLFVEGKAVAAGGGVEKIFAVRTAIANGVVAELRAPGAHAAVRLDSGSQSATVVVRRNLDTLFDHIDFATMDDKRIGREILQNLINDVKIELRVDAHAS